MKKIVAALLAASSIGTVAAPAHASPIHQCKLGPYGWVSPPGSSLIIQNLTTRNVDCRYAKTSAVEYTVLMASYGSYPLSPFTCTKRPFIHEVDDYRCVQTGHGNRVIHWQAGV